jgi:hypothetical protein
MNRLLWFLGTASLNYGVVTWLLGTLLLAVTFAVGPNLIRDGRRRVLARKQIGMSANQKKVE